MLQLFTGKQYVSLLYHTNLVTVHFMYLLYKEAF